ncbi:MAG: 23S rRNA (adenine(2030)-N(6))-methyltransferase RlmJ [Betaproteobacteria bacterium]
MFSYRHGFHAGNHADVLKHTVLIQLLAYLNQKPTPYMVIDTHAGAGLYQLDSDYASKSGEASDGVAKLWERKDLPPAIAEYVALIRAMNPAGKLRHYLGSPFIAEKCMRSEDRLRLFELHSTDAKLLLENVRKLEAHAAANGILHRGKRILAERSDGFAALKALLPPPSRRGLVLIDPPYENKDDYRKVKLALEDAQKRFASGTYAVWYPVLSRSESQQLPERLKRSAQSEWLNITLSVGAATNADGRGLNASGMFILNPPWTLEATLRECLPWLTQTLARDHTAQYTITSGSAAKAPKASKASE